MSISGDKIAQVREALGLTQAQFAAALMISRNYVSLLESGKKTASPRLLRRINALLTESTSSQHRGEVDEAPGSYTARIKAEARADLRQRKTTDAAAHLTEARRLFEEIILAARADPSRTGWILEQVRQHLRTPSYWRLIPDTPDEHPAVKAALAAARAKLKNFPPVDPVVGDTQATGMGHSQAAS